MSAAEFIIEDDTAGQRLDHFLAAQLSTHSRSRIQDLIRDGFITLDGSAVKPGTKVRAGNRIVLNEPPPRPVEMKGEAIDLEILFEDQYVVVVNKPAGMVVHPAAGNWEGTLVNALLHHCPLSAIGGEQRPGIVHRLDKETSGCMVAAKTDAAHEGLSRQFANRSVSKIYLAIATGHFAKRSGIIEGAIARHAIHRKRMAVKADGSGRAAKTSWRVLDEWQGKRGIETLVECTLHTGRTHQIRVHLKHIGHALLGDEVYGARGGYDRQMLHAWRLAFDHPATGARMHFSAPIPRDFLEAGVSPDRLFVKSEAQPEQRTQ